MFSGAGGNVTMPLQPMTSGIFGLNVKEKDAALILLPVPWEATVSYGEGAALGPSAILAASRQVDLHDGDVLRPHEPGIHLLAESKEVRALNRRARKDARPIAAREGAIGQNRKLRAALKRVNAASERLNDYVRSESLRILKAGKLLGVLGGDHSAPLGAYRAAARAYGAFSLLHFDAHHDFRDAYEGFRYSHASIMRNALLEVPQITKIVQVGIRDYCEEESGHLASLGKRAAAFYDRDIQRRKFSGEPFARIAGDVVSALARNVWVSFDIDGLDPRLCPGTGTPVPGGLDFNEANFILGETVRSGRRILGFDLVEVAPSKTGGEWDASVGARLLYKLCAWTLAGQGLRALL